MVTSTGTGRGSVTEVVAAVPDPEIPVVTIADLGILREVHLEGERVVVTITPTYSGCPAMEAIRQDVVAACADAGYPDVEVRTVLSPAWTTDWITDEGRARLEEFGIAPPGPASGSVFLALDRIGERATGRLAQTHAQTPVHCPQCGSTDTDEVSRFGSTACKSLWSCRSCLEPFDHFKAL